MSEIVVLRDNFDKSIPSVKRELFVFRGVAYSIDLGPENADRMENDLGAYVAVADKIGPAVVKVNNKTVINGKVTGVTAKASANRPPEQAPEPDAKPAPAKRAASPPPQQELGLTPPTDLRALDELPPSKDWLRITDAERQGPGSTERRNRGTKYRNDMRDWLRRQGIEVAARGYPRPEWIDMYWEAIVLARKLASG